jgi:hypothetical protein
MFLVLTSVVLRRETWHSCSPRDSADVPVFCGNTSFLWTVDWALEMVGVATGCGVTGEGAEEWRSRLEERLSRMKTLVEVPRL